MEVTTIIFNATFKRTYHGNMLNSYNSQKAVLFTELLPRTIIIKSMYTDIIYC